MTGLNKVILIGNVGCEPETRYIDKGFSSTTITLATSEMVDSAIGHKVEETEWHQVVAYGKLSAYSEQYIHKGDTLMVEGKLKSRYIREHDGFRTKLVEILANNIQIMARPKAAEETPIPDDFYLDDDDIIGSAIPGFDIDDLPDPDMMTPDNLPF